MFIEFPKAHRVSYDEDFKLSDVSTTPPQGAPKDKKLEKRLEYLVETLDDLQQRFFALDTHALLLVFQAMDAAGKDSTIRHVMRGINPAGCQVSSFKRPSSEELDHDFLWRTARRLPERGRIGIFNRSYYEEVLVVRVHPEYLSAQRLPAEIDRGSLWEDRYTSIREHERHLARNGTLILKFWLNVSREEQKQRFLSRLNEPHKNWKFSAADIKEREHWDAYMRAYEAALSATSRPWAPWYAIPADDKDYMRAAVAETVVATLDSLNLKFPEISGSDATRFDEARRLLEAND